MRSCADLDRRSEGEVLAVAPAASAAATSTASGGWWRACWVVAVAEEDLNRRALAAGPGRVGLGHGARRAGRVDRAADDVGHEPGRLEPVDRLILRLAGVVGDRDALAHDQRG